MHETKMRAKSWLCKQSRHESANFGLRRFSRKREPGTYRGEFFILPPGSAHFLAEIRQSRPTFCLTAREPIRRRLEVSLTDPEDVYPAAHGGPHNRVSVELAFSRMN